MNSSFITSRPGPVQICIQTACKCYQQVVQVAAIARKELKTQLNANILYPDKAVPRGVVFSGFTLFVTIKAFEILW